MLKALITGSAGLIGSQAAKFFIQHGFQVVGVDNNMRAYFFGQEASTQWNKEKLEHDFPKQYIHKELDIRDQEAMETLFKEHSFQLIIHTAAQPSHDWAAKEPFTDFTVNANGTLIILENFRKHCPGAVFIFTSTNKVYGDLPDDLPLVEQETRYEISSQHPFYQRGIDESMSIDQSKHSLFGVSKVAADVLVQEYGRYFGLKTAVFRGGCLTGPDHSSAQLHGFLAYLAKCIITGKKYTIFGYKGKQVRDNIHSYDLITAFYEFYKNPRCGEVYNMGGSRHSNISMTEAIDKIQQLAGKKADIEYSNESRKGDHIWYISDVSKFQSQYPDWHYKYDIDGILEDICHSNRLQSVLTPTLNNILITGGAGFVGSNLAIKLKAKYPQVRVTAFDNLKRRGSELNIPRLKKAGVSFVHGDVRSVADLESLGEVNTIIECSAEPSAMAGVNGSPKYLIDTNLLGTVNCLELARQRHSQFLFLSTSRVYPISGLEDLNFREDETRYCLAEVQEIGGVSPQGVCEDFPLAGYRTLYGATKLSSELLIGEYAYTYKLSTIINRCGVITGPWQMGKVDQGFFVLWVASHLFGKDLSYIGYGGVGKQVRDFMHIDDLFAAVDLELSSFDRFSGGTYNLGGGAENTVSLLELTAACQQITGKKVNISSVPETRLGDIRWFVTDSTKFRELTGWTPQKGITQTVNDIYDWLKANQELVAPIFS